MTSSTRHAESITNNSSLVNDNSPNLIDDFSPLVYNQVVEKSPTEIMLERWNERVVNYLPAIDVEDLPKADNNFEGFESRQFAPEFSEIIYQDALSNEFAIGNFFVERECELDINEEARLTMV